jgi:DNA-binding NarL/FixJ family response regulator
MHRPTVLLADDHAIVADGLRSLLASRFELLDSVRDGLALVEAAERLRPEVIVSDIAMPLMGGLDALREVVARRLPSRMIVLTMHSDVHLATEAFRLGAWGFLLKTSAGDELITAIHEVLNGRAYLTPSMTRSVLLNTLPAAPGVAAPRLTVRQRQVLQLVARGQRMKEIAASLGLSSRTVERHKYKAMHTLGLRTNAELIQYALRMSESSM